MPFRLDRYLSGHSTQIGLNMLEGGEGVKVRGCSYLNPNIALLSVPLSIDVGKATVA